MSVKTFFGWILVTIGGLLALLSGGCGLLFLGAFILQGQVNMAALPLVIGGVPFAIGLGLFAWGRSLLPEKNKPKEDMDTTL